jgi:hypothetical protein
MVVFYVFFSAYIAIGLALSITFIFNFFLKLEYKLDIRSLIITIASTQWILGAILSYWFVPTNDAYAMVVEPSKYFSFALPAVIMYSIGLYIPFYRRKIIKKDSYLKFSEVLRQNKNLDIILILSGLFFSVFSKVAPESLRFITFLLGGIKFVGLLMLLLNSERNRRNLYLVISVFLLLFTSVVDGSFGTLTYWTILMFVVFAFFIKLSNRTKIYLSITAVLAIFIMQAVKFEYRERVWFGEESFSILDRLDLFKEITEQQTQEGVATEETQQSVISRINQGWIISHIIRNMEITNNYANGESIERTILSVFLPGSLYPEKLDNQERIKYFSEFTGRKLGRTVAMGTSVLGEAYANYGAFGGIVFMFFFGIFFNLTWVIVKKIIVKHPLILFFIPMIFQQAIKAENNLFVVLNHIIKSGFFILLLYFGLSIIYNFKLKKRRRLSSSSLS